MPITLIRHGRPRYQLKGYAKARELPSIAKHYDAAGIHDTPPRMTVEVLSGYDIVVCSHLRRSLESASALGIKAVDVSDPLFAETVIPHFSRGPFVLPLAVWIVLLRILWLLGFTANGESLASARSRAEQAAERLIGMAQDDKHVVLVGHGLFNYLIAGVLLNNGWAGPKRPGRDYWEYGTYLPVDFPNVIERP
jgi:broad specificity phosphatase PhoE